MHQNLFKWSDQSSFISPSSKSRDKADSANQLALFFEILHSGKTPRINSHGITSHKPVIGGGFQSISGGSTGLPKIIERTCISWILSFNINNKFFNLSGCKVALFGSLNHSLVLYGALEGLHLGCEVHYLEGHSPTKQLEYLERENIEILYITPTQLRLMLTAKYKNYRIQSVKYVFIGGGSTEQNTLKELSELAPNAALKRFYGSSETSFISISDKFTPKGSVGKAYKDVEIILGASPNEPVKKGEIGRVWVRSPYLFSKYVGENGINSNEVSGWVSPGELAKFDQDQNLFILGRIDRIFKIKDQSIIPEEIERYLLAEKNIKMAAVVKEYDILRGNKAIAYIATSDAVNVEKLIDECISLIPPLDGSLKIIELTLENFPLLPSGKPDFCKLEMRGV